MSYDAEWSAQLATHPTVFPPWPPPRARSAPRVRPEPGVLASPRRRPRPPAPGLLLVPPFPLVRIPLACVDASFDRLLLQNRFPCRHRRRRYPDPNLFSPSVSASTGTPIRAARRGFICRAAGLLAAADFSQLLFRVSGPRMKRWHLM